MAKENYTVEMTEKLVSEYEAGVSVEVLAEQLGKTVRSIRSKLVREGVYQAPEKPAKAKREEGPTKKELLRDLQAIAPDAPLDGLNGATKEAIQWVIAQLQVVAETESEAEAA